MVFVEIYTKDFNKPETSELHKIYTFLGYVEAKHRHTFRKNKKKAISVNKSAAVFEDIFHISVNLIWGLAMI